MSQGQHLKMQHPTDIPINVTDVHGGRKPTLGSYSATLSVEDKLPYPINNQPIKIHMQNNLSSELVLGADFLKKHGAIIDMKSNNAIFMPNEYHPVSLSQKPIVCEAFASLVTNDEETPQEDIENYNTATFAVQPTEDVEIPFMDHVQIITANHNMRNKPGTTIMLTTGFAPDPQIIDGLKDFCSPDF